MPTPTLPVASWLPKALDPRSDRDLLARFLSGDEGAFAELVRRHGPMVLGVCERVLGNRDDAEDAYQSTFLALAKQVHRADWRESLSGWLHDVAWRTANEMRTRAARQRHRDHRAGLRQAVATDHELPEVLDQEIRNLPVAQREAVLCCYFQGLTRQQAADKLGCSLRTLERRLEEGRRRLRERLEARGEVVPVLLGGPAFSLTSVLGRWWLVAGLLLACGGGLLALPRTSEPGDTVGAKAPAAAESSVPPRAIGRLGDTRFRHGDWISDLALSADGKVLASSGGGRAVCLWDAATGRLLRAFAGPDRHCFNVAFSPDGGRFVAAMQPLRILDANTGKVVHHLKGHSDEWIIGVAWSADGKWIASSCMDKTLRVWDAATGEQRHVITKYRYKTWRTGGFVPGADELLTVNSEGFYLLNLRTGKERVLPVGTGNDVLALAYSRDGKRLAVLRGPQTGAKMRGTPVQPAAEACVWEMDGKAAPRAILKANVGGVALAFAPDGRRLAVGGGDGGIRVLEVETGKEVRRWVTPGGEVTGLVFSRDGKVVYSSGGESVVRRWDAATGAELAAVAGHASPVRRLRFQADGKGIVSLDVNHQTVHWALATGSPVAPRLFPLNAKEVSALLADGSLVALEYTRPGKATALRVFDTRTGKERQTLDAHKYGAFATAFDDQGKRVASLGHHEDVKVWDLTDGKCLWKVGMVPLGPTQRKSSALRFSRDGRMLAFGGYENAVYLFDAATGKELRRFVHEKDNSGVHSFAAAFSPDGDLVAFPTGFANSPIVLLETRTGKVRRTWRSGQEGGFAAIEFSPDGRLLATAGHYDTSLKLWDVATGQELASYASQDAATWSAAFSPDGRVLAAGGGDSTILLWDVTGTGGRAGKALTPKRLQELWHALAAEDVKEAYAATWELALSADGAVPFLLERVKPVKESEVALVDRHVKELGASEFATREKATRELEKLGAGAVPQLRKILEGSKDLEVRRRIEAVIAAYHGSDEWQRGRQALAALERGGSVAAWKLLAELARGADGAPLTEEAREILARARRPRE